MAVITPTITLRSNASTATTNAGPLSVALSLAGSDILTVDNVESQIFDIDHGANTVVCDGSSFAGATPTPGTNGCFIYMKNISAASATNLIYVGIVADGGSAADLTASGDTARLFTLKVGEFAWFPFDYTMDITVDASTSGQLLEYWIFDRG